MSRINPDSVRTLKDGLLRAKVAQIDNAGEFNREQAVAELYGEAAQAPADSAT